MARGSKKTHEYQCIINKTPSVISDSNIFNYEYKKNNINVNVCIYMLKKGISVKYSSKGKYAEDIVHDALKKVMLLNIIKYGVPLDVKSVYLIKDSETENKKIESLYYKSSLYQEKRFIYSLAEDKFFHNIHTSWQKDNNFMNNILLCFEKKEYQPLDASLYALILSKTKMYESERFTWLWKAINGMYNFYWENFIKRHKEGLRSKETNQINAFARVNNLRTGFTDRNYKEKIYNDVIDVINENWNGNDVTQETLQNEHKELAEQIEQKLFKRCTKRADRTAYDLDAYTYLLLDMAYYYRCNLFHANKPVKLFSFEEEAEIKMLKVLNSVMEDHIERNLPNWFDSEYTQRELLPRSETIAREMKVMQSGNKTDKKQD